MTKYELTGGARIGMANATWPLAKLKVNQDKLEINATIIGNLVFQPSDIISIEPYTQIPFLGQGIKINHKVEGYNSKVIFWTFKNPKTVIDEIKKTGFFQNQGGKAIVKSQEVLIRQKQGGFPIKKSVAIGTVILWNVLFFSDLLGYVQFGEKVPFGYGVITALSLVFLSSFLLLVSSRFREITLKEGRGLEDIKMFIYLLLFISGSMLFGFSILLKVL
ncbi:MAG: hypothetical protein AB8F94_18605 [Saprospiraceae bacterium]